MVLGSSDYGSAQRRLRSQKSTEAELRWAQGVVKLADEVLDLTPALVRQMKSEYLHNLEENASLESEEAQTV